MSNARARVHGRDEHERARQRDPAGAAGDADLAVFQRLAEHLQGGALELRQFVEKEHAVVRERDFTGARDRAAAEQRDVRDRVMRRAKRAGIPAHVRRQRPPRRGVDAQDLELLLERRRRHDGRDAFRDHGFSGARRTDHQQIVAPGDGHLDGAAQGVLSLDLGEIRHGGRFRRWRPQRAPAGGQGRERGFALQEADGAVERVDAKNRHAFDQRSLLGRHRGEQEAAAALAAGETRHRQGAAHRARGAGQAEFTGNQPLPEVFGLELPRGRQDSERDGQVVTRPLLAQMPGREVDRGAGAGRTEAAVHKRGDDAVVGLFHRGVRQPHEHELGFTHLAGVDLDVDRLGFDALQRGGRDGGQHGPTRPCRSGERRTLFRHDRGLRRLAAATNLRHVALDRFEVDVPAVGIGCGEKAVERLALDLQLAAHKVVPERGRAEGEVGRGLECASLGGQVEEFVRLLELEEQRRQLVGIGRVGHLAEEIGGGEGVADHAAHGIAELHLADLAVGAGATDRAEDDLDLEIVDAPGRQISGGEGATAQHMTIRVLGAGAAPVGAQLQVARVVQQGRDHGQFELAEADPRHDLGDMPALEQQRDAHGGLQRVVEIVIVQIDAGVIGIPAFEEVDDVPEHPAHPGGVGAGEHPGLDLPDVRRGRGGILGVNWRKRCHRWRRVVPTPGAVAANGGEACGD